MKLVVMDVAEQHIYVKTQRTNLKILKLSKTRYNYKMTIHLFKFILGIFFNVFYLGFNLSLANEVFRQDFNYIKDENRKKKCINLLKKGKLIFDKNSKLFYVENNSLMGAGITYTCNNKNEIKKNKKSFIKSFGLDKATLSTDESNLENIKKSKFSNFKPQQRLFCERKLKSKQLKFDEIKKQYYEIVRQPLGGSTQRNYICNYALEVDRKGAVESLLMANPLGNLAQPLVTKKEDTVTGNPFENPMMAQSILKLTKSQTYFLKALGEEQTAQISEAYIKKLESGTALGQDDLEKILVQCKDSQEIINEKMKESVVLDENAKKTFSQGIPYYTAGTAMLATTGVSAASMASGIGANPVGIIQSISVFFTVKDALSAIPLFFSSTNNLLDFGKEHNLKNIEDLQAAKDSLGV